MLCTQPEILAHFQGAKADFMLGMGFAKVAARIPHDIPVSAGFFMDVDEIRQNEIAVVEMIVAGQRQDFAAGSHT